MLPDRIRKLNNLEYKKGPILYWMNREIRVQENWAMIFARHVAKKNQSPLLVVYNLDPNFLGGGRRQVSFKLGGLKEVESELKELGIPFFLLVGNNTEQGLLRFIEEHQIGGVITDFSPLRIQREWLRHVEQHVQIPLYEVDAHNIVPVWKASPKQEFGAYTLRPKIQKILPTYLDHYPHVEKQSVKEGVTFSPIDWEHISKQQKTREDIPEVDWITPGTKAGKERLHTFLTENFEYYHIRRNDPTAEALSHLSPYLHYGMLSAQSIALEVEQISHAEESKAAFLEELIIRRELADNFCYYNPHYDKVAGFPDWAKRTHEKHRGDKREYLYTYEEFEEAQTHDPLWNACQKEMTVTGKMHGYMRMYWAKKILEWTPSVEVAMEIAIKLNDTYELDGRDPNGYTGVAWALGGVHDRAWVERDIFGQIRYMNDKGCKRKFDVEKYIRMHG